MAVYRFPLSRGAADLDLNLPLTISVMHAGERICEARLDGDAYECDLSREYFSKLTMGRLEQVFVYEPPLIDLRPDPETRRELVSILLVNARRVPGTDELPS